MFKKYYHLAGLVVFLFGWILACVAGYAMDVYRVSLGMPFVVFGAVVYLWNYKNDGRNRALLTLFLVSLVYLITRAILSPIREFREEELMLLTGFGLSFMVGWRASRTSEEGSVAVKMIWGTVVCVFGANIAVALYQYVFDMEFAFLNVKRTNLGGVSGLYWHRNYLAGFLEFFLPVVLAICLFGRTTLGRISSVMLLLAGLGALFLSHSRGGFIAAGLGLLTVFLIWLVVSYLTKKISLLKLSSFLVISLFVLVIGLFSLRKISEDRGRTTNVVELFAEDERIFFASMGIEQWMENPLVGGGSRSFDYWSDRNWHASVLSGRQNKRAVMVHNDYVQLLSEYGLFGFCLLMAFLAYGSWKLLSFLVELKSDKGGATHFVVTVSAAGAGCLIAAGVHSLLDFNLHILPNLMLFALILGSTFQLTGQKPKTVRGTILWKAAFIIPAVVCVAIGAKYWLAIPSWLQWENARIKIERSFGQERAWEAGLILFEKVPTGALGNKLISILLDELEEDGYENLPTDKKAAFREVLERSVEVNPYDGVLWRRLGSEARMREESVEEIEESYMKAMAWKARRERSFGAMWQFGELQRTAALRAWKGRRTEEALMRFELALEFMQFSREAGYWGAPARSKNAKEVEEQVSFLRGAGIKPLSRNHIPSAEDFYDVRVNKHNCEIWRWDVENH